MPLRHWLLLLAILGWASIASSQTLIGATTLSAAVDLSQSSIVVSSGSGWTVGQYAYVDYEAIRVINVNGTLIGVTRQQFGTKATTHASGTTILFGNGLHFKNLSSYGNSPPIASCVRADQPYLPIIDYTSGNLWTCNTSGRWQGTNTANLTYNSIMTPNY